MGSFEASNSENDHELLSHDVIKQYLANIDEHIHNLISCHFYRKEDGPEEWSYFADPSKIPARKTKVQHTPPNVNVDSEGKPKKGLLAKGGWAKVRKSVGLAPCTNASPARQIILEPPSQIDLTKKTIVNLTSKKGRRLTQLRKFSLYMNQGQIDGAASQHSQANMQLDGPGFLNYMSPEDAILQFDESKDLADQHYSLRYKAIEAQKNRRRSTISRKFSINYS